MREEFIRSLMPLTGEKDHAYKLALISVGVDALISTTLHSIIKVLSNHGYQTLIQRKHFHSNGIKHLERGCVQDTLLSGQAIKAGQRLRLYVEAYQQAGLSDLQMNKKFFAADSPHACIGFSYSLSIWKELMNILKNHFSDLHLLGFDYRANDAIFNFPTHISVEYTQ